MRSLAMVGTLAVAMTGSLFAHADGTAGCATDYEHAQRLRKAGQLVESRASLLACAQPSCPAFIRSDCTTWLAEVDATTPTVVIAAVGEDGRDLASAAVSIDGVSLPGATDGLGHALDPGLHVFRLMVGSRAVDQNVVVRSGEKERRVELRLPPLDGAAGAPPPIRPVPSSVFALGGLAVLSIGTGSVLWATGTSAADRYNTDCGSAAGCTSAARASVLRQLVAGDVLWGVGIASAVTAAGLFLARPSRVLAATTGLVVTPVRGGGVAAAYECSF
jgi:hypothetical protein